MHFPLMSSPSLTEGGRLVHSEDWGWRPHVLPEQGGQQGGPPTACVWGHRSIQCFEILRSYWKFLPSTDERTPAFPRHAAGGMGCHPDLWVPSHVLDTSDDELRHGNCERMKRAFVDNNHAS